LRNSSPSLWYCSKKVKAEAILCILGTSVSIIRTHLVQNLWYPNLTVIISYRTVWHLWKFTWKFWNSEEQSSINFFGKIFEQDHHSLQMTDHFALHHEPFAPPPISEHSTPLSYSSVTHYILALTAHNSHQSCF
jgi:hypothetical protein